MTSVAVVVCVLLFCLPFSSTIPTTQHITSTRNAVPNTLGIPLQLEGEIGADDIDEEEDALHGFYREMGGTSWRRKVELQDDICDWDGMM